MALAATKMFQEMPFCKKLYYGAIPQKVADIIFKTTGRKVWGRPNGEITTAINTEKYMAKKIEAAKCHLTQMKDVERMLPVWQMFKEDYFVLANSRVKTKLPENDLFSGIYQFKRSFKKINL
jgi:hypothetical protein